MRAKAFLGIEVSGGRSVVRELRSQAPLRLVPRRGGAAPGGAAVVHLVGSAASPLGGDELELEVRVGPGARLRLAGTAATVALPGRGSSRSVVRIEVAEGGTVEYLPDASVISERADHRAELSVVLGEGARARCRETLVLGRHGEASGRLVTSTHLTRGDTPLFRQRLDLGCARLAASSGYLGDARVIVGESLAWDNDPREPASGAWWSLSPFAAGGCLATAVAEDAVTAAHRLDEAIGHHPDAEDLAAPAW